MKKPPKKPLGKLIVTQSNNLIEADYSKAELSANALKLFKLAIATLSPKDEEFRLIRIKMPVFKQYMGYKQNTPYGRLDQDIEKYCLALNSQVVSIVLEDGSVLKAFAISSYRVDHNKDELVIEISGQLKPFLLQLKGNHTSYQLWNIPRLKSSYSIRLYELLSSRRRFGKRSFEVEELKAKVGCTYPEYGIFKRRVILKAQKELSERTDLRFDFEEGKTGRKVTEITFYTYPNDPKANDSQQVFAFLDEEFADEKNEGFTSETIALFKAIGISKASLDKMLAEGWTIIEDEDARQKAQRRCRTIHEYFGEKITLLQQSKAQKNPAGFLVKAIKEDWQNPALFRKKKVAAAKAQAAKLEKQVNALERKKEGLTKALDKAREEAVLKAYEGKDDALSTIIDSVVPIGHILRRTAVKKNLTPLENYKASAMLSSLVNGHIRDHRPQVFEHLKAQVKEVAATQKEIESLKLKM
jgi:plasmid replication initiation protein